MKKLYVLLSVLCCVAMLHAQTYPFNENFQLQVSSQVPTGWSGDMLVRLNHGQNDGKGLTAKLGSTNKVDSVVTPLIGPFTSSTSLVFFYRIVDQYIYPSTPTLLSPDDSMNVQLSADGVTWRTVYQVNEDNHTTTLNFIKKKVYLTQNPGESFYMRFYCQFGGSGSGYFVDIDSVVVNNDPQAGINDAATNALQLYPNPAPANGNCNLQVEGYTQPNVTVTDATGRIVYNYVAGVGALNTQVLTLPSAAWCPGLYMLQVHEADGSRYAIKKLVIE